MSFYSVINLFFRIVLRFAVSDSNGETFIIHVFNEKKQRELLRKLR